MRNRSVCITVDSTTADLHEQEPRFRSTGHRCSVPAMELSMGLCPHQEMSEQSPLGRSTRTSVDHTDFTNSNWVFNAGMDVHQKTLPDSNSKTVAEKPQGRESPPNQPRVTECSHMASITNLKIPCDRRNFRSSSKVYSVFLETRYRGSILLLMDKMGTVVH